MRVFDHHRHPAHLAAWRELNQRVAEDLRAGRGEIKPAIQTRPTKRPLVIGRLLRVLPYGRTV